MRNRAAGSEFTIRHARTARCEPEVLMARILDPSSWPRWQPEILEAGPSGALNEGDGVEGRASLLGFVVDGRSTAVSVTETSFEEDVIVGVRMRVRYEVKPAPEGARITRHLVAVLPGGVSGRLLSFFLKWRLRRMQVGVLDGLVAQAESG